MPEIGSDPSGWLFASLLFALVALLAVAAQAAIQHASRPRMRLLVEARVKGARGALAMLADHSPMPTMLLFLLIVGIGGAAASLAVAVTSNALYPSWEALIIALLVGAGVLLLAIVTRAVAASRPETTALALGRPLTVATALTLWLIAPLLWLERSIVGLLTPPAMSGLAPSEDDLRLLVESVEDTRKLDEDEREMIHGIFGMSARPVREVMVPRIDVVSMPRTATLGEILDRIVSTGYSRIPLADESVDDVVGLVYAKDVLRALRAGALDDPAEPIARTPYFVPDTKKVDELLQDLQQKRTHLAIVVDEYGGTAGIVTIEDLLEEIVGEIRDEYDEHEEVRIQKIDEHESVVDARVSIRDVNEALDLHLDVDELDTLGGLVYHELGKVPAEGDEVRVNGCLVTVLSTEGRRIKKLRVRIVEEES
ncbi:MAG TPA: hemolysin family protein [Chloroflexota bacterium]|nr:hemolysin family protein [Chloroflexota bacterium]